MGGLAALAREAGHRVTGCDAGVYPPMSDQLRALGIELIEGFGADQMALQPDMFVIGNVVSRTRLSDGTPKFPLMEAILDVGAPYTSGPQWLAEHVLQGRHVLAVAGTHGKTTTTAMLAWILESAGLQPGFLVGGVPMNFGISARLGGGAPAPSAQVKEEPAARAGDTEQSPLPHNLPEPMREFCLVSVLRNILGVACWLVDSRIPLQAAQFPFDAPAHQSAYAILFSGPTTFSADHAAIHFDARYLNLPLRRDEKALQQMLQHALPLTVLQYRRDRLLVQRVRQTLATHAQQTHSAEALAALLHVSPRTLHRQLKEEGATLQGLKDEVRQARAIELLNRTDRPIKQVAEAAGFQNEKSFIRAFKGWTGQSPAEFRRQSVPA